MLFWDGKGFELKKHFKTLLSLSLHLLWASHGLVPFSNNRMVFDRSRQSMPRFRQNTEVMTSAHFVHFPLCMFKIKMHSINGSLRWNNITKDSSRVEVDCKLPFSISFLKVGIIKAASLHLMRNQWRGKWTLWLFNLWDFTTIFVAG